MAGLARSAVFGRGSKPAASSASTPTRRRRSRPSTPARTSSVVTPTASGKTLCYALPVLQAIAEDPAARALFLFPTKALGQDQVAEFSELSRAAGMSIAAATYDGDTPAPDPVGDPQGGPGRRDEPGHAPLGDPPPPHEVVPAVRAAPGHRHRRAAHVPRRVRQPRRQRPPAAAPAVRPLRQPPGDRVLLGDDREPGRAGRDADRPAVAARSTATARRPASGTSCSSTRRSSTRRPGRAARPLTLAQRWALPFLRAGRQTIVFGRARVAVEIMLTGLREALREDLGPRSRVRGYRGGYLPTERRAIERGLRDGEILGVVATNALELGVDIGRLDVSILAGYPGSVAATWQQIGRAGRRGEISVAILVASAAPVDQYVIHHPEFLLGGDAGGGAARPRQPPRPARPPPRGDVRAAVRAGRGRSVRGPRTTCSRSSPSRGHVRQAERRHAGTGARRTSRPRRSRCGPPRRRTS